jgi:folate-binding protein YgfZ
MHYPTESDMPSNLQLELQAIREGAAIAPITDRAFLRITGSDATRWLNGMVTNNIKDLAPGEGNYNFLLNAQGRIQGDCTIYREPNEGNATFLLETDKSQIETIHQILDKFIIMDDVELSELRGGSRFLLVLGPRAVSALESIGLPYISPNIYKIAELSDGPIALFTNGTENRFVLSGEKDQIEFIRPKLGLPELSPEALKAHRILTTTPRYGQDIRDRDLPQETAQTHALHFAKGCYLGQEIVERIRSRGQVHRTFTQFRLTGTLPELPAPLEANGKPAGELTSAIQIGDDLIALGYARREALDTHQTLTYPGGTALQTHISNLTSQT